MPLKPSVVRSVAERDDVAQVEVWLGDGVDLSTTEESFLAPLSIFAGAGAVSCVERLIEAGLPLDAGDPPPVLAAALGGHREVLERLLAAGASLAGGPYHEDYPGPFDAAVQSGNASAVELLARMGAVEASHPETLNDALASALASKPKVRRSMVSAVVSALLVAGHLDIAAGAATRAVRYLATEAKKDPALADLASQAKALLAGQKAQMEEARESVLERRVGDLVVLLREAPSRHSLLAGLAAVDAANGYSALVETLIPYRPRLDLTGESGRCALVQAVRSGAHLVVSALLDTGFSRHIADNDGRTALDYAIDQKRAGHPQGQSMQWWLERPPVRPPDPTLGCPIGSSELAARAYALTKARKLPELFELLNSARGEERRFAAGGAVLADCEAGGWTLLEWLLDSGADVRVKTSESWDALFAASRAFHLPLDLLRRLVAGGADLNAVDTDGNTLLGWARRGLPASHPNRLYLEGVMRERGIPVPPP